MRNTATTNELVTPVHPGEHGFTLVEFMIASVAALALMAATFTILNSTFTANASMKEMLETQQAVRVAINTLARDITMAGTGLPSTIVAPNGLGSVPLVRPGQGIALPTPNNTLAIVTPGEAAGPNIIGNGAANASDVITIATIDQQSPTWTISGYTDTVPGTDANFNQNIRSGSDQLFATDVLLFTNVNGAMMGCVTAIDTTVDIASFDDGDACGLNQSGAASGNFMSTLVNPDLSLPPTTATRINVIHYYLIDNDVHGHPALFRAVNAQAPQEIIEGIESIQLTYDLYDFTTLTATANVVPPGGFTQQNQIRSVNITINGRSPQALRRTGQYYRFGLTTKVNIRNTTFRNRYNG